MTETVTELPSIPDDVLKAVARDLAQAEFPSGYLVQLAAEIRDEPHYWNRDDV